MLWSGLFLSKFLLSHDDNVIMCLGNFLLIGISVLTVTCFTYFNQSITIFIDLKVPESCFMKLLIFDFCFVLLFLKKREPMPDFHYLQTPKLIDQKLNCILCN